MASLTGENNARGMTRRSLLQAGAMGLAGASLGGNAGSCLNQVAAGGSLQESSVILVWLGGGPSHLDTWDPKPAAPAEIRGALRPIATRVPGIEICELLPKSAMQMDKFAIVRSLTHTAAGHDAATHHMLTGHRSASELPASEMPSAGSVIARELGSRRPGLPAYVALPQAPRSSGAAHLGARYDPCSLDMDPNQIAAGMPSALTAAIGPAACQAFALECETPRLRERYGRNKLGQSLLLARRLAEAGVTLVTVDAGGWDTHANQFESLGHQLPEFDRAWSALLSDLVDRSLLGRTLVLACGEFGRTPRINAHAGRDHWPGVMSALVAGGGLAMGQAIGSSDTQGAYPRQRPITPEDLLATVYHVLGVDPRGEHFDDAGIPHQILATGTPIKELVG